MGEWLDAMLKVLPDGAEGTIHRKPVVVTTAELGPEHEGYWISVIRDDIASTISGRLQQVYPTYTGSEKIVVVRGKAHTLKPYEVATLTDWTAK